MAFDLDNEELRATRKMRGLDDGLYEDKMSEEDFKILDDFKNNKMQRDKLERDNRCGGWKIGHIYKQLELNVAIEHLLTEREQDKKRIQGLEKENKKKDKIIDNAITEVENIRQYFSEDLQTEFIRVLEILKDKKVIDW